MEFKEPPPSLKFGEQLATTGDRTEQRILPLDKIINKSNTTSEQQCYQLNGMVQEIASSIQQQHDLAIENLEQKKNKKTKQLRRKKYKKYLKSKKAKK